LNKQINSKYKQNTLIDNYKKILISMMPVIPHLSSECLSLIKVKDINWPKYDKDLLKEQIANIVVQINGKKRGLLKTEIDISENDLLNIINNDEKILKYVDGKEIKKKIYIKNKLINIIL
jgi:leucyl-tRNA synthetase